MTSSETLSLRQVTGVLRRRKWLVLQLALIVGVAAAVLSWRSDRVYNATASVLIGPAKAPPIVGLTVPDQTLTASTGAHLVRTRTVARHVKRALGSDRSLEDLLAHVSASGNPIDDFIEIVGRGSSGAEAAQLANAFAQGFVQTRAEMGRLRTQRAMTIIAHELVGLPATSAERASLSAQFAQLRTFGSLPGGDAEVVDRATAPTAPVGPHPFRNGLIGLALGLLLGVAAAFALEALDPRVKSSDELNALASGPYLANVPAATFRRGVGRIRKQPRAITVARNHAEAFERVRTSLLVSNADRDLKVILVTSPSSEREGKTLVAANLAVSLAKTGLRACVLDADFRSPRIARHFGFDNRSDGLSDVLQGAPLADAINRFPVLDAPVFRNGNGNGQAHANGDGKAAKWHYETAEIAVVGAGTVTQSSSELIASDAMLETLDELEQDFDVVIVDCPPLLAASDGMPLIARADGTVLVVRLFHTTREDATRAMRLVESAGGTLVGVVGTGAKAKELRQEGYGPWPASQPHSSGVA